MLDRQKELELISGLRTRSRDAWVRFFQIFSQPLCRRMSLLVPDSHNLNTVITESIIEAAGSDAAKILPAAGLWNWIWHISSEHLGEYYKSRGHDQSLADSQLWLKQEGEKLILDASSVFTESQSYNLEVIVRRSLVQMKPIEQSVIIAKYVDAMTARQISRELDIDHNAFHEILIKAHKSFYDCFEKTSEITLTKPSSQNEIRGYDVAISRLMMLLVVNQKLPDENLLVDLMQESVEVYAKVQPAPSIYRENKEKFILGALCVALSLIAIILSVHNYNIKKTEDRLVHQSRAGSNVKTAPVEKELTDEEVAKKHEEDVIKNLLELLNVSNMQDKLNVAKILGNIGDESCVSALFNASKLWQGTDEDNPFLNAIEAIHLRSGVRKQDVAVDENSLDDYVSLKGRLVDSTDEPLVGASVKSFVYSKVFYDASGYLVNSDITVEHDDLMSDSDGYYEIGDLASLKNGNVRLMYFSHPDKGFNWVSVEMDLKKGYNLSLTLPAKVGVEGVVVGPGNMPLSDVIIEVEVVSGSNAKSNSMWLSRYNNLAVRTSELGRFVVDNMPEGADFRIFIYDKNYLRYSSGVYSARDFADGGNAILVQLESAYSFGGKLILDGEPLGVGGVKLKLSAKVQDSDVIDDYYAFTDENGEFVFGSLEAGVYKVGLVEGLNTSGMLLKSPEMVIVGDDMPDVYNLEYATGQSFVVSFIDEAGEPLKYVSDFLLARDGGLDISRYKTDENGVCRGVAVPGEYSLLYYDTDSGRISTVAIPVVIDGDKVFEITLTRNAKENFTGRVILPQSDIHTDTIISVDGNQVPVGTMGEFSVPVADFVDFEVFVSALGGEYTWYERYEPSVLNRDITINLVPSCSITGRLIDESGNPLSLGYSVMLVKGPSFIEGFVPYFDSEINEYGEFEFSNVPQGLVDAVVVKHNGYTNRFNISWDFDNPVKFIDFADMLIIAESEDGDVVE